MPLKIIGLSRQCAIELMNSRITGDRLIGINRYQVLLPCINVHKNAWKIHFYLQHIGGKFTRQVAQSYILIKLFYLLSVFVVYQYGMSAPLLKDRNYYSFVELQVSFYNLN